MTDHKRSSIQAWAADVKDQEDDSSSGDDAQSHLGSPDDKVADPDFEPDEEPAPVPDFEGFPIGNTPAGGEWGLTEKDQRAADLAYRQEQNIIKQQERRTRYTKRKDRGSSARNKRGPFTVAPPTTITIPTAVPKSQTDTSLNLDLHYLDVNGTAPSISTGLAGMGLKPATHNRKRNRQRVSGKRKFKSMNEEEEPKALETIKEEEATNSEPVPQEPHVSPKPDPSAVCARSAYVESSAGDAAAAPAPAYPFTYSIENAPKQSPGSYNTYPSSVPHPTRGKIYVDAAIQTDPPHVCMGDCQCPIWVTPKSATAAAPATPRVRKVPPHVALMHRMMAVKREADVRRDAKLKEAGLEPPRFDPNDPEKVVFYEKKALESGGFEFVKQVWRNGKRIE